MYREIPSRRRLFIKPHDSFGIGSLVPTRGAEPSYLVAEADSAFFECKQSGGDKITVDSA